MLIFIPEALQLKQGLNTDLVFGNETIILKGI